MPDPATPEWPGADEVLAIASGDLEASRGVLQRLLGVQDALLAGALTVPSVLVGVTFSSHTWIALVGIPLVIGLWVLDGVNWVHCQRMAKRIRSVEMLFHSYSVVLRESGGGRPQALRRLRREIDRYQYGAERVFENVERTDFWRTNWRRLRFWLFPFIALVLLVSGLFMIVDGKSPKVRFCAAMPDGSTMEIDEVPTAIHGQLTITECPKAGAGVRGIGPGDTSSTSLYPPPPSTEARTRASTSTTESQIPDLAPTTSSRSNHDQIPNTN